MKKERGNNVTRLYKSIIFSCEANEVSRTRENKEKKRAPQEVVALLGKAARAKKKEDEQKIVKKARMLAMKYRLRLPVQIRRKFCKKCNSLWRIGKTLRIRTSRGKVVYTCLVCKKFRRFAYSSKKDFSHSPKFLPKDKKNKHAQQTTAS